VKRSLAVLVVGAALACGTMACGRSGTTLFATFDDVGDLVPHHAVQIADVRVGEVTKITMTPSFRAEVEMRIAPGIRVPADSIAIVRTTSLLGEKFIELRPASQAAAKTGPFLQDGATITDTAVAPELESVTQDAISLLGAVRSSDMATLVNTGAQGFGGQSAKLRSLIGDLAKINATLRGHDSSIAGAIDGLGQAASTLAKSDDQLSALLSNLAGTTTVLSNSRTQAIDALTQIDRLARSLNVVLQPDFGRLQTNLRDLNAVVARLNGHQTDINNLVTYLEQFAKLTPEDIPGDFSQVYAWLIPQMLDTRAGAQ
jgi:phospholipid/cholesterol/gamma-HCH transport system substrate-binding protein